MDFCRLATVHGVVFDIFGRLDAENLRLAKRCDPHGVN